MKKGGFTLVELIAVITILSIVVILMLPTVTGVAESSRLTMRDSKIKTILVAAEKYGNDLINRYQSCVGTPGSDCYIPLDRLILNGYLDADDEISNTINDPSTNEAFTGSVLLCFDQDAIEVYAKFIEEGETGDCN